MTQSTAGFQRVIPYLVYEDGAGALEFLCRVFGFQERLRVPREDGTIMHAEVVYHDNVVMLGAPAAGDALVQELKQLREHQDRGSSILCYVDDVDAHYTQVKAAGATITMEIETKAHGERYYGVADPGGHRWFFSMKVESDAPSS